MTAGIQGMPERYEGDTSDWTPINIEAPLPMGVAGALMQLIGAAWPDAVIVTGNERKRYGTKDYALNMLVPPNPAQTVDEEFAAVIRGDAESTDDAEFLGFDDGWIAFAPPEELCLRMGHMAHAIFIAHEGAINYVEWEVRTGNEEDDSGYQLSIAKSKGQAPGVLWKKEQEETARLRALLVKNGIDPDQED